MRTGDTNYIYKNDLDGASFQPDMVYGKYKDLTDKDKVLKAKLLKLQAIQNMMDIKED